MDKKILYDDVHINSIVSSYKTCETDLSNIIDQFKNGTTYLNDNYSGQASTEINPTATQKMEQHLSLLLDCITTTRIYVEESLELMKEADKTLYE